MWRKNLSILLLVGVLFRGEAEAQKLLPSLDGALYQGAMADFGPGANEVSVERIQAFEGLSGRPLVWAYFANDWLDGIIEFPHANVAACRDAGRVPYIRLMPWSEMADSVNGPDPVFRLAHFLSGRFDEPLRRWARAARDSGGPLLLEFGPEANGDWFPWNGRWNGGARTDGYGDPSWPDGPERFRDTFRRVVELFRAEGAHNVTWVLHLDVAWSPEAGWNAMKYYYPGDGWVDWIGLSVFGAQLPNHGWSWFSSKLDAAFPQIEEASATSPLLIAESAVIEKTGVRRKKEEWIHEALSSLENGRFPRVKGFSWWHSPGWLPDGSASFRIDSSSWALAAYRQHMARPFWTSTPLFSP